MSKGDELYTKAAIPFPEASRWTDKDTAIRKRLRSIERSIEPYLYISPAFLLFGVFTFAPLLFAFYLAFTDWDLISSGYNIVWFDNFVRMASDQRFWRAVKNTVYFTVGTVPTQLALALLTHLRLQ